MSSITHTELAGRFASADVVKSHLEHQASEQLREYQYHLTELLRGVKPANIRSILLRNRGIAGNFMVERISRVTGFSPEGYAAFLRQNY